jgi:hypothetical protein
VHERAAAVPQPELNVTPDVGRSVVLLLLALTVSVCVPVTVKATVASVPPAVMV